MNKTALKNYKRMRRHNRIRAKVKGTESVPRLAIFRSARHITAQLINDDKAITIVASSDIKETKGTKVERATQVGTAIAKAAKAKSITKVVFDRGGFLYAGRVKALADAARAEGLVF